MNDIDNAELTEEAVEHLRRIETRYHLFKAFLIVITAVFLGLLITYETDKSVNNVNKKNERVENLLRCSLPAFTPQNYENADKIINKCLEANGIKND